MGIIKAEDRRAVEGDDVGELEEGFFDLLQVTIVIHVLPVDVGDDGEAGAQFEKGAVAFVGLDDHVARAPEARVGAAKVAEERLPCDLRRGPGVSGKTPGTQ